MAPHSAAAVARHLPSHGQRDQRRVIRVAGSRNQGARSGGPPDVSAGARRQGPSMSRYLTPAQIDAKNGHAARTTSVLGTRKRTTIYRFVRHLVEMIVAMMIGMAALGALWRALVSV